MQITVFVIMSVPAHLLRAGQHKARGSVVFTTTYVQKMDRFLLDQISCRSVRVRRHWRSTYRKWLWATPNYDGRTNTLTLSCRMPSSTKRYINHLKRMGWKYDEKVAGHYNLPRG